MAHYFLDSSVLVKRYIREAGTARVVELVRGSTRLGVARIAIVEVTATLARRCRGGDLDVRVLAGILGATEDEFGRRFEEQPLTDAILAQSVYMARTHALRAADAIQLASAVYFADQLDDRAEVVFVSSDEELNEAARREALAVLDPALE
jgi:hypothetical protein